MEVINDDCKRVRKRSIKRERKIDRERERESKQEKKRRREREKKKKILIDQFKFFLNEWGQNPLFTLNLTGFS